MIIPVIKKTAIPVLLVTLLLIGWVKLSDLVVYAQSGDPVIAGAGDISTASTSMTRPTALTANTIEWINPYAVLVMGDNQYPDGALDQYNSYYTPTWGRFKAKTHPVPGNHEYHVAGAQGYFDYFNGVGVNNGPAGERGKGYYSYNIGSWHIIALNSEADFGATGNQVQWLANDLQANQNAACTLAYWHNPRFSSGQHGSNTKTAPFWDKLYQYKADIVLAGHDHTYERFAPQSPSGVSEPTRGIREFVVGTGGAGLYSFTSSPANSQYKQNTSHGVLKLTLHSASYDWQFIKNDANHTVLDSGSYNCVTGAAVTPSPSPTGPTRTPTPGGATPTRTPTPSRTPTPGPTLPPGSLLGDANGDCKVDGIDYVIWLNNFVAGTGGGNPSGGDFNRDGRVDGVDYVTWLNQFVAGATCGGTTTPTRTPTPSRTPTPGGTGYLDNAMCNPDLGSAAFTTTINNNYLPFTTGYLQNPPNERHLHDNGTGFDVRMRILTDASGQPQIKLIPGADGTDPVRALILEEFETQNGNWVETSRNWFAQTVGGVRPGTVCYFGENVFTPGSPNGGAGGSWQAGQPNARAGIMMPAGPITVGMNWLIEDAAAYGAYENGVVNQTGVTFTTPAGTFNNVIYILEDNGNSNKRYAPGVGMISDEGAVLTQY